MTDLHKTRDQDGFINSDRGRGKHQGSEGRDGPSINKILIDQSSISPVASLDSLLPDSDWPEPVRSLGIDSLRRVLQYAGLPSPPPRPSARSLNAAFEVIRDHGLPRTVDLEFRFVPVALAMQERGVLIDRDAFDVDYRAARDAYRRANIRWSQTRREHGLPDADPRSDEAVARLLNSLGHVDSPAVREALTRFEDFRDRSKELSALERLRKCMRPDGAVRGRFHPVGTVTGRPTVVRYDLVNFPRRLRHLVVTRPGHVLAYLDIQACDLQLLAHLAGDEALLAALRRGEDLHKLVTATILDIDPAEVTAEDREDAKALNLALVYGRDAYVVAKELGIFLDHATLMIQRLETAFPTAINFLKAVEERTVANRMSRSLAGRLMAHDRKIVERRLRRQARNRVVQGSGADIVKDRLVDLHDLLDQRDWGHLLVPMNDGVLLEVRRDVLDEALPAIGACFANSPYLDMPLRIATGHGATWAVAQAGMATDTNPAVTEED